MCVILDTYNENTRIHIVLHHSTAASTWWCGPRPRLGWVKMTVGLPEGPSYPGHSPFIFSLCCSLNDRRRAAHSFFKIGRLFSRNKCKIFPKTTTSAKFSPHCGVVDSALVLRYHGCGFESQLVGH